MHWSERVTTKPHGKTYKSTTIRRVNLLIDFMHGVVAEKYNLISVSWIWANWHFTCPQMKRKLGEIYNNSKEKYSQNFFSNERELPCVIDVHLPIYSCVSESANSGLWSTIRCGQSYNRVWQDFIRFCHFTILR